MSNPRKQLPRRSDEDWYRLIMDCRKSGLSDAQFCRVYGIPNSSFCTAIKRLRKKSFAIPEADDVDIYDLTLPKQDVVKVDIVPDIQPPQELIPEVLQSRKRLGYIYGQKPLYPITYMWW